MIQSVPYYKPLPHTLYRPAQAQSFPYAQQTLQGMLPAEISAVQYAPAQPDQNIPLPQASVSGIAPSPYPREMTDQIQGLLKQCRYGPDLETLMGPGSPFSVSYDEKGVFLNGFFYPPLRQDGILQGACKELTLMTGLALQQAMGEHYQFTAIQGRAPQYFQGEKSIHYFLIATPRQSHIPNTQQERLAALLDNAKQSGKPLRLPDDILIIDPSLQRVGTGAELPGYRAEGFGEFQDAANAVNLFATETPFTHQAEFNAEGKTQLFPLGFFEDLFPMATPGFQAVHPQKSLLWFGFEKNNTQTDAAPTLVLHIQRDPNSPRILPWAESVQWLNTLPDSSPLKQWHQKVQGMKPKSVIID